MPDRPTSNLNCLGFLIQIACKMRIAGVVIAVVLSAGGCERDVELVRLEVDGQALWVEIADSPEERALGLMHRESLRENHGMLFVYDRDQRMSYYMKDTLIPLSIAFLTADGRIVEIHDMKPLSLDPVQSSRSVRYALEVNQGGFERMGVEPGDYILMPAKIR